MKKALAVVKKRPAPEVMSTKILVDSVPYYLKKVYEKRTKNHWTLIVLYVGRGKSKHKFVVRALSVWRLYKHG